MTDEKNTGIFVQNLCLQHRYIRSKDLSTIVERPERLRAVNIGLSAAIARLEELFLAKKNFTAQSHLKDETNQNDLIEDMNKLSLGQNFPKSPSPVTITFSEAVVDLLNHPAVKFIHGDIERDVYLENLQKWATESVEKIKKGESEIPDNFFQGDLYLCPGSINAIQGAIGMVCEAVDKVMLSTPPTSNLNVADTLHRAFVAIRPPGHHCGENTPSGFCFVNNVAIGAAHAHLNHGIKRVVILDIDLHHGNGTQSIVWQINEESYRQTIDNEVAKPNAETGLQIYYGSIHDVLSYPCEDGKLELVQAASVSIHKAHGQYIENVHLETYNSEEHFWNVLYKQKYTGILRKARDFLDHTGGPGEDVIVFISCGMDACEHEFESMSRHNRKVPTSFYYRFAQDACALSDEYAKGRVISVLEGGYSDRALMSGAMAHLAGLVDVPPSLKVEEDWWSVENLVKLESATKKRRGGRPSLTTQDTIEGWLERTLNIFASFEAAASKATASAPRVAVPVSVSSRTLRDKSKTKAKSTSPTSSPPLSSTNRVQPVSASSTKSKAESIPTKQPAHPEGTSSAFSSPTFSPRDADNESLSEKKLPKVILKLGKP